MKARTLALTLAALTLWATHAPAQTPAPLLVDAAWLSQHLNDRNLVILHVDDEADYRAGHIPGARFITLRTLATQGPLVLELPTADDLRGRLQTLGISDTSRIVVTYGKNGPFESATRVVLTLDAAGLGAQTSILNGGATAWTKAGHELATSTPAVTPGTLSPRPLKPVVVDVEYVKAIGQKPAHVLADGRAAALYAGITPDGFGNVGHIPGAVSIPFTQIVDNELKVDRARIERLFRDAGVKPGDTVIAYCHIGQQGTAVVFGARLLGHQVMLYDGSMQDWARTKGPVVK